MFKTIRNLLSLSKIYGGADGDAARRDRAGESLVDEISYSPLDVATFFRCLTVISSSVASWPWISETAPQRLLNLLNGEPFPGWSGYELRSWCVAQRIMEGRGYVKIHRDGNGSTATGFEPMQKPVERITDNGKLIGFKPDGEDPVDVSDMVVISGPIIGTGPVSLARTGARIAVQEATLLNRFGKKRLTKGFLQDMIVLLDERLTKEALEKDARR